MPVADPYQVKSLFPPELFLVFRFCLCHSGDFKGYRFPQIMKVLHQEILVNINDGLPVPNYFVYKKPDL